VRIDYVNPLFEELGWDISNAKGLSEAYREVIHEDSMKIGGVTKAPDYCFRSAGVRKFFLDAKKTSVNIREAIHPAYQLRRYGWSANLPVSILTDFEEFAVYDCRVKPAKTDKALQSRILYLKYTEYEQKWNEIKNIFSRDAVLNGSFDQYAETQKTKKGTERVDAAFLQEIENWREFLAGNIALRNSGLSQRELNFAVQQTIDRIVFLRICEDRGIENYGSLMSLQNGENIWKRLFALFRKADAKYNSGLFHFRKEKNRENFDSLTPKLIIDDSVLKNIFKNLYYPDSPYEFSVLPADILGQVYEKFLSKVIRLTAGHQAKIEEKPEVRKAGGVYYTPTYIVNYIVKNTVGKLLDGKKQGSVKNMKILDPACGSGSFLIGACQFLLDWYLEQYIKDSPEKKAKGKKPVLYQTDKGGDWRMTTGERKRILLSHIYGVDIDSQAVEVTKLSLLLKVLEGENEQSIQMSVFQERVLPDLSDNIRCGNSLIGPDFYANQQRKMNAEEMYRVNAFDWNAEFAEIMKNGGFDAVIGNPPYGALFTDETGVYLKEKNTTFVWRGESYLVFVEKAFELLKKQGFFGFIVPDTFLNLGFTQALRTFLLQNSYLQEIVLLPSNIFKGATVDTALVFAQKAQTAENYHSVPVTVKVFGKNEVIESVENPSKKFKIDTDIWYEEKSFNVQSDKNEFALIHKIENRSVQLKKTADLFYGIKAYQTGKGKPPQTQKIRDEKPFTSEICPGKKWKGFYDGKHIGRYELLWKENNWLHYGSWLAEPRKPELFEGEKILIRKIVGQTLIATYISETSYCNTLLFILKIKDNICSYKYLLGILNAKLTGWYFRKKFQISAQDTFPQIMIRDILQLPIVLPANSDAQKLNSLVEQMLALHKKHSQSALPQEKKVLQRQIEATDSQIDQLVYKLYDLTEEEIRIVEGET